MTRLLTAWVAVVLSGCALQTEAGPGRWCEAAVECRDVLEAPALDADGCQIWTALAGGSDDAAASCDELGPANECLWAECVLLTMGGWESVGR